MIKKTCTWIVAIAASTASPALYAAIELKATDQPPLELFALVLGGIGIFLTGIHFAGSHLQKITGGSFKTINNPIPDCLP